MAAAPTDPQGDQTLFIDAMVPGDVHVDLERAGLIEKPVQGLSALAARWVEGCQWWYRRTFEAPAEALAGHAWIVFEQLDLNARIFLNGKLIGTHQNAFRPFRVEVSKELLAGENHLAVEIESGVARMSLRPTLDWEDADDWNRFKREWLRKPAYQIGWDFTCRYLSVGIGGHAYVEFTDAPVVLRQIVPLVELAPDLRSATVRVRFVTEALGSDPVEATLRARVAGATAEAQVRVDPGEGCYEVVVPVDDPQLWWPAGHGEQALHELCSELILDGVHEERTTSIGFRRVEVNQEPHPDGGRFFVLTVNNRPIFCKGGNMSALDMIPALVDASRYERLIALAREAHFNFFRINGVGIYETDEFYELCDRHGILVMQDFALSVARFPATDQGFLDEIRLEARHQVRRLASHPSLVIWCGGNENEWHFWDHPGNRPGDLPDRHLYRLVLPEVLEREDPTRVYVPSSPHSPDDLFPNADDRGDQHPWAVGFPSGTYAADGWDIRQYREMTCRFPDEGGVLGPPALPTIKACMPTGEKSRQSIAWHLNDNGIGGRRPSSSDEMLRKLTGLDPGSMDIEDYAYWGGLVQAEGLREYTENFRRRMFDSAAACFWSFNECWPTTRGWSVVDYYLRRTPGFWAVRRAMAPIHVVVALDGDTVGVYGVNDTPQAVEGELLSGFFHTDGPGDCDTEKVVLRENSSTLLRDLGQWRGEPTETIAFAALRRPGFVDARSRFILPTFGELHWAQPNLSMDVSGDEVTFESDSFVWGVCIDLDGEQALPDNFFDVWPGIPYTLPWPHSDPPVVLHVGNRLHVQ